MTCSGCKNGKTGYSVEKDLEIKIDAHLESALAEYWPKGAAFPVVFPWLAGMVSREEVLRFGKSFVMNRIQDGASISASKPSKNNIVGGLPLTQEEPIESRSTFGWGVKAAIGMALPCTRLGMRYEAELTCYGAAAIQAGLLQSAYNAIGVECEIEVESCAVTGFQTTGECEYTNGCYCVYHYTGCVGEEGYIGG